MKTTHKNTGIYTHVTHEPDLSNPADFRKLKEWIENRQLDFAEIGKELEAIIAATAAGSPIHDDAKEARTFLRAMYAAREKGLLDEAVGAAFHLGELWERIYVRRFEEAVLKQRKADADHTKGADETNKARKANRPWIVKRFKEILEADPNRNITDIYDQVGDEHINEDGKPRKVTGRTVANVLRKHLLTGKR